MPNIDIAVWFALYAPLSFAYRLVVMTTVALFVAGTLRGLGVVLAVWTLAIGVGWPVFRAL